MDIERMTKNPNPDFFIFFLWGGGGGECGESGQGDRAKRGVGGKWEQLFSCVTHCFNPNARCYKFSSRYSIWLPSNGLHMNSL